MWQFLTRSFPESWRLSSFLYEFTMSHEDAREEKVILPVARWYKQITVARVKYKHLTHFSSSYLYVGNDPTTEAISHIAHFVISCLWYSRGIIQWQVRMLGEVLMKIHSNKNLMDVKSITLSCEVCYEEMLVIKVSTPLQGWPSQMLVCHKAWDLKKNPITSFPTVVSIAFSDLPQCSVSVWDNAHGSGPQRVKVACIYTRVIIERISTLIKLSRYVFTQIFTPLGLCRQSVDLQKLNTFFFLYFSK